MTNIDRRSLLVAAATAPLVAAAPPPSLADLPVAAAEQRLVAMWNVDRGVANLDAAYYGAMPRDVHRRYLEHTAWVNRENSLFLRSALTGPDRDARLGLANAAVAELIGARADEIALANGGTEALYALITNYRGLEPGDAVITADVDYDEMQYAMGYLRESRGAQLVGFAVPEPSTDANVLAAYDKVLRETPRAKLLLLSHVSNRNGLVLPVRDIIAMAKARDIDVILDAAQSVGQLPFDVDEVGADFVGFSLHKWIAAPLGTGAIYVRRERQKLIAPYMGNRIRTEDDVRARILTGTANYGAQLSIPDAIAFHRALNPAAKLRHLQALRDHWVDQVCDLPTVEILQPGAPSSYGAIAAFRLPSTRTWEGAQAMQARLLALDRVMVVAKRGLASGPGMRVTPALFTTRAELNRLVAAIRREARAGS